MKIIQVENQDFKHVPPGGIGTYLANLLKYLEKNNIDFLCVGSGEKEPVDVKPDSGIPALNISSRRISNLRFLIKLLFSARKLPRDRGIVYHLHHPYMIFPFLLYKNECSFLLTLHGRQDLSYKYRHVYIQSFLYNLLQKYSIRHYDRIIAVNNSLADHCVNRFHIPPEKISVIPVPVQTNIFYPQNKYEMRDQFGFLPGDKIILYAGRVTREKNLPLLIESFSLLKKSIKNLRLVIAGEGGAKAELENRIRKEQIEDVVFYPAQEQDTLAGLLGCSDVFALCSENEGSPTVIREALACNIPVVSTDVGDVKEIIQGMEGCFIALPVATDFSMKLFMALNNESEKNYSQKMEQFDPDQVFPSLLEEYYQLSE